MIDFFSKCASVKKNASGAGDKGGEPDARSHTFGRITKVGTFFDEEDEITSILLEVADSEETRRRGLMGRDVIPGIYGMLFEGLSGGGHFWMKNCLVPLDVAFMKEDGTITKIYSMPLDEDGNEIYKYGDDDTMAVEVKMGFMKKWGIGIGFRLETRKLNGAMNNG